MVEMSTTIKDHESSSFSRFSNGTVSTPSTNRSSANLNSSVNALSLRSNNPSPECFDGSYSPPDESDSMFGGMSHEWRVQNGLIEEDGSPVHFNAPDDAPLHDEHSNPNPSIVATGSYAGCVTDSVATDGIDAVDQPIDEPEVLTLSDDDSSSIIAWSASDSVAENSLVLDPAYANQWAADIIAELMKPFTEQELKLMNNSQALLFSC
jgi:hypothetical protein